MNEPGRRLASVGLVVLFLFSALLVRVALLGTVESDALTKEGQKALYATNPIPATRGRIEARDGRVLVGNLDVNVVELDASKLPRAERTAVLTRLASVLDIPFSTIESRLVDPRNPRFEPARIATNVKESTILYINEHLELFPGVTTDVTWQRVYPYGRLASHVLGYLGRVNPDDIKRQPTEMRYQASDLIGRTGVEKSFERELRGVPGEEVVTKDPLGRVISSRRIREPIPGKDVRLTVDIDAQRLAEETCASGVKAARKNVSADNPDQFIRAFGCAIVAIDVNDGQVIASASYPDFDPAEFANGLSLKRDEYYKSPDNHAPLVNRVIEGLYPPGSTFKLFTAIAALQNNLITPNTPYLDQGAFEVAEFKKKNIKFRWKNAGETPFGTIALRDAIRVSSDAFFYRLGYEFHRLGNTAGSTVQEASIQNVAKLMGLGKYTNIRLPGEAKGIIPDRARQEALHRAYPKKFAADWPYGATINVSIGQGQVLVTPLQLARAYAALANGGTVLDARIDLEVRDRAVVDRNATVAATTTLGTPPTTTSTAPIAARFATTTAPTRSESSTTTANVTTTTSIRSLSSDIEARVGVSIAPPTTLAPLVVAPRVEGHIDLSDSARDALLDGFSEVVGTRGGTAVGAFEGFPLDRYRIAGKTGTAQKDKEQDYSVFVGFGPLPKPKYAVAAVIEQGGFGRQSGALVRHMFEGLAGLPITPVRTVSEGGSEQ